MNGPLFERIVVRKVAIWRRRRHPKELVLPRNSRLRDSGGNFVRAGADRVSCGAPDEIRLTTSRTVEIGVRWVPFSGPKRKSRFRSLRDRLRVEVYEERENHLRSQLHR